jgi:hypothetical protein
MNVAKKRALLPFQASQWLSQNEGIMGMTNKKNGDWLEGATYQIEKIWNKKNLPNDIVSKVE